MDMAEQQIDTSPDVTLSDRLGRLRADVMARPGVLAQAYNNRCGSWVPDANPFARTAALLRAWTPGMSVAEVRAATLLELVRLSEVRIYPDWRLAGEHCTGQSLVAPDDPRFSAQRDRLAEYGIGPGDLDQVRNVLRRWHEVTHGRTWAVVGRAAFDPGPEQHTPAGQAIYTAIGWVENHSIRDYPKLLRLGFSGLRREIEAALQSQPMDAPAYARGEGFWRAALLVCDAGGLLGQRYAAEARRQAAASADPAERERLTAMAELCERVPEHGARTLVEAVQALWFGHILTCGEDGINANSIGRLDQMLQPYYEADVRAGRQTRESALELMLELACKLYQEYDVQAITLGGRDAAGTDLCNTMTEILLEATARVGFVRDLSVRVHADSPAWLFRQCARMLRDGGGIPFLFNDDCFIPALIDHGIDPADVRDYAPIGCIELTIPGKTNPHAVSGWFHLTKCLELALFNGVDPRSGRQLGPRTGEFVDFASFADFYAAYRQQVEYFTQHMIYLINRGELMQQEGGPLPCWSLLTDACIARGRDITDGGAVYTYHSVCVLGTANTADSLCAVRQLVFEQKRVAPAELLAALRADFDGSEPLRQLLLRGAPKYGNDEDAVDLLAREVDDHFIDLLDQARSPQGGRFVAHLFTFLANISYGAGLGATPDGRRAGEPIAYSLSAQQGRDEGGATAMLRSLAKLPHRRAAGASAAILDLDPKCLAGADGVERLARLLEAAVKIGVGQLQVNVVTAERLRQARQDPERFGNIPVRVAGYSQMFRLLSPELQDHVIARTKHER
jgi:formate C-acetyltransferase